MKPSRRGDLDINEDLDHQRALWRVQRVGWTALVVALIAALLGLFGVSGPLNHAVIEAGGSRLIYERFPHLETSTGLQVRTVASREGYVELALGSEYLANVRLTEVIPEPDKVQFRRHGFVYLFRVDPDIELAITLHVTPQKPGLMRGEFRADEDRLPFTQFVYP